MRKKFVKAYMDVAERFAKLSHAEKLQVGAIIVKEDKIISIGYNGMPSGFDNGCEDKIIEKNNKVVLKTKPEVLHAEANAITKLACSVESGFGASIFVTHAPCMDCAKLIYQSGIKTVYYKNEYKSEQGFKFLEKSDVKVYKI